MSGIIKDPKLPETYYDKHKRTYYVKDGRGDWIAYTDSQYKRYLQKLGFSTVKGKAPCSDIDNNIVNIEHNYGVEYAGPIAGNYKGLIEEDGQRILVTSSPSIIMPNPGEWLTIEKLLDNVLGGDGGIQLKYFYAWLKLGYEALLEKELRVGQCLVLCGPAGCGKSLLQKLITKIFGGRVAKPYAYMTGKTQFNSDLIGAEHLCIEDEQPATDIKSRRAFGSSIKDMTVNDVQRLHQKHRDALTVKTFSRVTISLNDEEENVMILPLIDDSIQDKVTIFKARNNGMPMPSATLNERKVFMTRLTNELPAFLDFLRNWKIPDDIKGDRYGVIHFHHPEILEILHGLSAEKQLLRLIDIQCFSAEYEQTQGGPIRPARKEPMSLPAEALWALLTDPASQINHEARKLLSWPGACGTLLGRLAKIEPNRVQQKRTSEKRLWIINPPHRDISDEQKT